MNWQHQTLRNLSNSLINKEISSLELCEFFLEDHFHIELRLDILNQVLDKREIYFY